MMVELLLSPLGLTPRELPRLNAALNGLCAYMLVCAWSAIRRKRVTLHRNLMMAALMTSVVFLASYLYFHFVVKDGRPTKFTAEGLPRIAYFAILLSHTLLAIVVAVMAPVTLFLGFGAPGNNHRRLGRWILPIWLYVSVTGVIVYLMLYHLYPPIPIVG